MVCKWQVEIDDYATRVLAKHWPTVHRERDIRQCGKHNLKPVDVICGGFPCQDISSARTSNTRQGLDGSQSGLWSEYFRIICEVRPRIVVVENVSKILIRGLHRVLSDLAGIGCAVGWRMFCSAEFGFPYMRKRVFVVASTDGDCKPVSAIYAKVADMQKPSKHDWKRALQSVAGITRDADGLSCRMDRSRGLGNAVVPQVAEWIGRKIVEATNG